MGERPRIVPELRLVAERPVRDLLPNGRPERAEASGVLAQSSRLLVIFDDSTAIGVIDQDLTQPAANHTVRPQPEIADDAHAGRGYEDIAHDPVTGQLYLLVEAVRRGPRFMPRVEILDADYRRHSQAWLDFPLEEVNKGMEGLTCVNRDGGPVLVALCEGNRCRGGREGEAPGGGRLQLFRPAQGSTWMHAGTINLPSHLWFIDYSSIAIRRDRIAVISQRSSALWVGTFRPDTWDLVDPGASYEFPRDRQGRIVYGTAEGVSWLDDDHVVVVSDRAPASQPRWKAKHRSLHIFAIPPASAPGIGRASA